MLPLTVTRTRNSFPSIVPRRKFYNEKNCAPNRERSFFAGKTLRQWRSNTYLGIRNGSINGYLSVRWMEKGWDLIHRERSPFPKGKAYFIRDFLVKT